MTAEAREATRDKILPIAWEDIPWWAVILAIVGITVGWSVLTSEEYLKVMRFVLVGVKLTLQATVISYLIGLIVGLIFGLMRVSDNPILYAVSTLYVEVMRGIPLLVIILYMGFVLTPMLRDATDGKIDIQGIPAAIIGMAACYGAYMAEVYRGGIESIERGQMEAARSLGMSYMQAMRNVILPQAIRRILPPLGNNFISMLKDSSLVSVIALSDLLQMGRLYVSRTFRAFEGYNTVALLYLIMTLFLSLIVRTVERKAAIE
ncbi:MAG: amino acid ABC transporter permease [Chloroflexota bacterium]|nr:amino acid ABC transporter permease [Chloroflexota bacterium]